MKVCHQVLSKVERVVWFVFTIVREVARTVCGWVTSIVTTLKEVCEEVCGWLGPLSFLCDWVCDVIEVVETVTPVGLRDGDRVHLRSHPLRARLRVLHPSLGLLGH